MKIKQLLLLLLLQLCLPLLNGQNIAGKDDFMKYAESVSAQLNAHFNAKEYNEAIGIILDLKERYYKLETDAQKELNLNEDLYYTLAALYACNDNRELTLKYLKEGMTFGKKKYPMVAEMIYPKYKNHPAFAKCFRELYDQQPIELSNMAVSPANIAQPGSGVEHIADQHCTTDAEMFHTLWGGIDRQPVTIEADLSGKGRRLDKIVLQPRGIGFNGIIKKAEIWIMVHHRYTKIATVDAALSNRPIEIVPEKPIRNPQKIKVVVLDSYGEINGNHYMVSLGELQCFTVNNRQAQVDLRQDEMLFADSGLALKQHVTRKRIDKIKIPALRTLATELLGGNYLPGQLKVDVKPMLDPVVLAKQLNMGDGFSKYEGITGIFLEPGDHYVFVDDTKGAELKLLVPDWLRKTAEGTPPDKDPQGWGLQKEEFVLRKGINRIHLSKGGNAYVQYFTATNPDDYDNVNLYFPTGKVNGCFDITKGDNDDDFDRLLDNAVGPILDLKGKQIQMALPVDALKQHTRHNGVALVQLYDSIVGMEKRFIGWEKQGINPQNHILARVNCQYFMFRDYDGVAFVDWAMDKVADPLKVATIESWGVCHELGHVFQMPQMTWSGMGEVSNNIITMYATTQLGNKSRLQEEKRFADARKNILDKGISYMAFPHKADGEANIYGEDGKSTNVFERLVPFWQLHLYFSKQGYDDFYPDLMIALRQQTAPDSDNPDKGYLTMLAFCKQACIVSKTDLTDFFERWGFFYVGEINIVDYRNTKYLVTQQEIDALKREIAEMDLPKPKIDITTLEN